jgi:hypothetical protein
MRQLLVSCVAVAVLPLVAVAWAVARIAEIARRP